MAILSESYTRKIEANQAKLKKLAAKSQKIDAAAKSVTEALENLEKLKAQALEEEAKQAK